MHDVVGNKPAGDSSDLDWRPLDIVDSEPAPVGSGRDGPGDQSVRFWPTDSDVITQAREVEVFKISPMFATQRQNWLLPPLWQARGCDMGRILSMTLFGPIRGGGQGAGGRRMRGGEGFNFAFGLKFVMPVIRFAVGIT